MNNAKVYAPQVPSRYDTATRLWVPTMDLAPAKRFGELVVMLPPGTNRMQPDDLMSALHERMRDFGPGDHLIAVGDPLLIAAAAIIAARQSAGELRLLKWDRIARDYASTATRP